MIDSKRWKGYVWVDSAGHARRGRYSIQPAIDTLWWCRFRTSAGTRAWRTGARGERATARQLRPLKRRGGSCCMTWPSLAAA